MYCMQKTVSHTKEFADERFGFERFHFINVFSCSNECNGTLGGRNTVREGRRKGVGE